jgi:hypothetical protein
MTFPIRIPNITYTIIRSDIDSYNELNIPMVSTYDINGDRSVNLYDTKSQVGFRATRLRINSDNSIEAASNANAAGSYIVSICF